MPMKDIAKKFKGLFVFLVTPTLDDGERVDEARLRSLIDTQIAAGVDGITVFGSTGANGSFTEEERKRVIAIAVEHADRRVPVVTGTGSITTSETIRLSKYAASKGVDGVLVVPITYWPLKDNEILSHYGAIAAAINVPLGIYNNPTTTGTDIKPELIARLARIDNVAFVKESSGIVERIVQIHRLTDHALVVVNGKDSAMLEAASVGVDGWYSGGCNLIPDECVRLFATTGRGDYEAARAHFMKLYPIFAMQSQKSTLRVVQTGLDIIGASVGAPRSPLRLLEAADRAALTEVLHEVGVLR